MRIGVVSTYPPIECGIATYSQFLCDALRQRGNEVFVFSERGGEGENVFQTYNSLRDDIAANISQAAAKVTPDLLHIQHEFGLYGEPIGIQIIELILRCNVAGLPVVTTFHTVREKMTREQQIVMRVIVQESTHIIVHEEDHKAVLDGLFGTADKTAVIPHGIREIAEVDRARERIGVKGKKVILLCGYLRETKRFDRVVKVFPAVAKAVDNAVLVIAGKSRSVDHPEFQQALYKMIEESPATDRIVVLHGQFPQPVFDTILSAADVVALPYEIGAQSGIMAHCFAFRKPVVASDLKAFRNWIEASRGGLIAGSDKELQDCLTRMLQDNELRQSCSQNIARFVGEKASWRIVARQHMDVYKKCAWRPTPKSRYFG